MRLNTVARFYTWCAFARLRNTTHTRMSAVQLFNVEYIRDVSQSYITRVIIIIR